MSARELPAALVDELPEAEPVAPITFLEDELLPFALALVEPDAFALACMQAWWGPCGSRN